MMRVSALSRSHPESWKIIHTTNPATYRPNGPMWLENAYELLNAEGGVIK